MITSIRILSHVKYSGDFLRLVKIVQGQRLLAFALPYHGGLSSAALSTIGDIRGILLRSLSNIPANCHDLHLPDSSSPRWLDFLSLSCQFVLLCYCLNSRRIAHEPAGVAQKM